MATRDRISSAQLPLADRAAYNANVKASPLSPEAKRVRLVPELQAKKWGSGQLYDPDFAGPPPPTTDALHWWACDEPSGDVLLNTGIAGAPAGTIAGTGYLRIPGVQGPGALDTASATTAATVPYSPDFDVVSADDWAICCWIYQFESAPNQRYLMSTWDVDSLGWRVMIESDERIRYGCGGTLVDGGSVFPGFNQWFHVCVSRNGVSGDFELYVNGGTRVANFNGTIGSGTSGRDIYLGSRIGDPTRIFAGRMDDFRFYDKYLSGADIDAIIAEANP